MKGGVPLQVRVPHLPGGEPPAQHLLHSQGVDLQQQRSQPAQLHQHHHTQRAGHCREEVEGN